MSNETKSQIQIGVPVKIWNSNNTGFVVDIAPDVPMAYVEILLTSDDRGDRRVSKVIKYVPLGWLTPVF